MSKGESKITISVPATGYNKRMFFNRFSLQKIDNHTLVHFGLIDSVGLLRDYYVCMLTRQVLKDSKPALTGYLAKVGGPQNPVTPWVPPAHIMQCDFANVIFVGQSEDAEIIFAAFAVGPAINLAKQSANALEIQPVALLRCDPDLQRSWIAELYSGSE